MSPMRRSSVVLRVMDGRRLVAIWRMRQAAEGLGTALARIRSARMGQPGLKLPRRTTKVTPAEFE